MLTLANDLGGRVSEDLLRRRIEGFNDTPCVNDHHAVDRGVEKGPPSWVGELHREPMEQDGCRPQ